MSVCLLVCLYVTQHDRNIYLISYYLNPQLIPWIPKIFPKMVNRGSIIPSWIYETVQKPSQNCNKVAPKLLISLNWDRDLG